MVFKVRFTAIRNGEHQISVLPLFECQDVTVVVVMSNDQSVAAQSGIVPPHVIDRENEASLLHPR